MRATKRDYVALAIALILMAGMLCMVSCAQVRKAADFLWENRAEIHARLCDKETGVVFDGCSLEPQTANCLWARRVCGWVEPFSLFRGIDGEQSSEITKEDIEMLEALDKHFRKGGL